MKLTAQPIKIGWGSTDITPDWPVNLQGQFHMRIATKVLDPLTATALALESDSGDAGFILISVDAVGLSAYVQKQFAEQLAKVLPGFDPARVAMHATHTHTAPQQNAEAAWYPEMPASFKRPEVYGDFMAAKLATIAAQAWNSRKAGGIAWGTGYASVGFNRRTVYLTNQTVMYGTTADPMFSHVEGNCDHGVDMLFTFDAERKPTGVLINVPCPSQCTENLNEISADYWHDVRVELHGRLGKGLFILPQCSAAGDQSPHLTMTKKADERMLRLMGLQAEGEPYDFGCRRAIAKRIAQAVTEALPAVSRDIRTEVELVHQRLEFPVPRRLLTPWETNEANRIITEMNQKLAALPAGTDPFSHGFTWAYAQRHYYVKALERHAMQKAGNVEMPVTVHAMRIGDVAMCTNRFEYYLDFGQRIKARSPALQTFVVQLAGEGGYLPTARSVAGGGYGSWFASAPASDAAGTKIVEESLRLINQWF